MQEGRPGSTVRWGRVAAVAYVAVLIALGFSTVATAGSADPTISLARARDHVAAIATEPHPMGSPEIVRVREYLVARLGEIGLTPELQPARAPDYFRPGGGETEIANVLARLPGTGDGSAILFVAHHDTVPETPGANDNSAPVAALLESARMLADGPPLRNDLVFLFTDGEEPTPRFGMSAFTGHPWFEDVKLAVNLEGIGEAGPALLAEVNGSHAQLVSGLSTAIDDPVAHSFMTATADLIGGAATDFDVIRETDIPGMSFVYLRGSSIYHTDTDTIDRLNDGGLLHLGRIVTGVARHFGNTDLGELEGSDRSVFLTLPAHLVVVHPAAVSWLLIGIGMLLAASGVVSSRRTRQPSFRRGARTAGIVLAGAIVSMLALTAAWWWVVGTGISIGVTGSYIALAIVTVIVVLTWIGVTALTKNGTPRLAVLVVWGLLAVGATLASPGLGVQFVWVFALASVWFALSSGGRFHRPWSLGSGLVAGSAAVVLTVPLVDTFFLLSGPRPGNPGSELPEVMAVVVFVVLAVVALVATVGRGWWDPAGR